MYKNILVLPDGTELSSGPGTKNAIKIMKSTQMVNSGEELTIGSACSNMLEATLFTPGGDLDITAGDELVHYKVDDRGERKKIGLFTVEEPTRPTPNTMKIAGYDRVSKLDKDLSAWLDSLDGWPYSVNAFASMTCAACGVTFVEQDGLPNANFQIKEWKKTGATGRQIMRWLGEIVCRYVYADPDGNIRFSWYKDSGKSYGPAGDNYFFAGSLSYENYQIAPIEAVQIGLADSENGAVWPQVPDGTNSYIIAGNPILMACVTEDLLPYLNVIEGELAQVAYTPCELSVRATLDVNAGDIICITDKNGKAFSTYVMSKITTGQRDTMACTGSQRRDSASALNNKSEAEKMESVASAAISAQTQIDIFNKLTNNGQAQAIYMDDNRIYINATYIKSGKIISEGMAYLPPTYDDCVDMLWSLSFPDKFPPEDFYDLNGDGVFDVEDVRLANKVYLGQASIYDCAGAVPTSVTVTIDPFNAENTVILEGTNMWGSQISMSLGVVRSQIPRIDGDCAVSGRLSVGGHAVLSSLAMEIGETPKTLSWKDNGDGTWTLIGQ